MKLPKKIEDKINEGRSYRDTMEFRAEDDGYTVRGYATTFNQPYVLWEEDGFIVMEQVDPDAFDECDMTDVIMQYDHEGRVFARTSNDTLGLSVEKDAGLETTANLGGTEIGRQLYEEIKGGYTTKMSFGFKVREDKREIIKDENGNKTVLRTITKIAKLFDVSAVSLPANPATSISARNYGEGVIAEFRQELAERERRKKKIRILTEV